MLQAPNAPLKPEATHKMTNPTNPLENNRENTPAERRAQTSRQNGAESKGPTTPEGKASSS